MLLIVVCLIAMALALFGIIAAIITGTPTFLEWVRALLLRRRVRLDWEDALMVDRVVDQLARKLAAVEAKVHYRYNVHCATCGRFARKIGEFGATDCTHCGMSVHVENAPTGAIAITTIETTMVKGELVKGKRKLVEIPVVLELPAPDVVMPETEHAELSSLSVVTNYEAENEILAEISGAVE